MRLSGDEFITLRYLYVSLNQIFLPVANLIKSPLVPANVFQKNRAELQMVSLMGIVQAYIHQNRFDQ